MIIAKRRIALILMIAAVLIVMVGACIPLCCTQGFTAFAYAGSEAGAGMDESAPALSTDLHSNSNKRSGSPAGSKFPSRYDSRDYGLVTPVRNQEKLDICWAYATIAAIESSILAHYPQVSSTELDLSERQLAYFSYNLVPDALGNTEGDQNLPTRAGYANYIQNYGNAWLTSEVMASGIGVVDETVAPETELKKNWWGTWTTGFEEKTNLDASLARGANSWRLSGVKRIPANDKDQIKQAIIDNGGVATLMFLGYKGKVQWTNDLRENDASLYNYGEKESNHMVTIVGWDDNFDTWNFEDEDPDTVIPESNGAWLCKNSFGTRTTGHYSAGDKGYFWLSYEDCYLQQPDVGVYAFDVVPAAEGEILYQYDGAAGDRYNTVRSGGSIANMFTAKGCAGQDEVIRSVCLTSLNDVNVNYAIQIYTDCTDPADPTSGEPAFAEPQRGSTTCGGYYTIPLNEEVSVKAGSRFSVVMTLSHSDKAPVSYDVDSTYMNEDWQKFVSAVSSNQSFERDTAGAAWDDLASASHDSGDEPKCAARIKAIAAAPLGQIDISSASVTGISNKTYTGKAIKMAPVVKLGGRTLVNGADYTVSYSKNKDVGMATVTIKGTGNYTGAITKKFSILPKPAALASVRAAKKAMKVRWKKQSARMSRATVTGYQIQYSRDKKFKKAAKIKTVKGYKKTSQKIRRLKSGKTYYVRVRTYMKTGGCTYYSKWSKVKKVKIH